MSIFKGILETHIFVRNELGTLNYISNIWDHFEVPLSSPNGENESSVSNGTIYENNYL